MTFTPSVLSKVDPHNSRTTPPLTLPNETFTGTGTLTTGFDTLIVTVQVNANSTAGGLEIQFSDDNVTYTTFAADTVLATGPFTKTYLILKQWYRIQYTTSAATAFEITSRLSTNIDSSVTTSSTSVSVFNNQVESSRDAFGRARVASPSTLLDIRYPALPQDLPSIAPTPQTLQNTQQVNLAVTGNYNFSGNGYMQLLAVAPGPNPYGYALTQSRTFITYQPGKSLLCMFSGLFKPQNTSYSSYIGLFNTTITSGPDVAAPNNGMFLSFVGGVAAVNVAKAGTLTTINQSDWNIDKMDGSGPSGLTLDFLFTQLFVIDLEWLGVGRVRFGFYAYGVIQYCHQVTNLNVLVEPYTPTANLPITYLLSGTATSTGETFIRHICSTVISEGGYNPVGRPFSANTGFDAVTQQIVVDTTETPLIAIRGNVSKGYYHQSIVPTTVSVIDTDNNNTILYRIRYYRGQDSANVTGTNWASVSAYSLVEYAVRTAALAPPTLTFVANNSIVITSGYILGKGSNSISDLAASFTSLLLNISADELNTPDILLFTAQRVGTGATTAKVWASLDWQEVY